MLHLYLASLTPKQTCDRQMNARFDDKFSRRISSQLLRAFSIPSFFEHAEKLCDLWDKVESQFHVSSLLLTWLSGAPQPTELSFRTTVSASVYLIVGD